MCFYLPRRLLTHSRRIAEQTTNKVRLENKRVRTESANKKSLSNKMKIQFERRQSVEDLMCDSYVPLNFLFHQIGLILPTNMTSAIFWVFRMKMKYPPTGLLRFQPVYFVFCFFLLLLL